MSDTIKNIYNIKSPLLILLDELSCDLNSDIDKIISDKVTNDIDTSDKYISECEYILKELIDVVKHIPNYLNHIDTYKAAQYKHDNDLLQIKEYDITLDKIINTLKLIMDNIGDKSKTIMIMPETNKRIGINQISMSKNPDGSKQKIIIFISGSKQLSLNKNFIDGLISKKSVSVEYYLNGVDVLTQLSHILFPIN
jgi:hypothetical protein